MAWHGLVVSGAERCHRDPSLTRRVEGGQVTDARAAKITTRDCAARRPPTYAYPRLEVHASMKPACPQTDEVLRVAANLDEQFRGGWMFATVDGTLFGKAPEPPVEAAWVEGAIGHYPNWHEPGSH